MLDKTGLGEAHALSVVVDVMVDVQVVVQLVVLLAVRVMVDVVDEMPVVPDINVVVNVNVGGRTSVVVVAVTVVPEHSGQVTQVAQVQSVGHPRYSIAL